MAFFNIFNNKKTEKKGFGNDVDSFMIDSDHTKPKQSYYRTSRGYLFGDNGLFPNELNSLYSESPLHSAIINYKTLLTSGGGFELVGYDSLDMNSKILVNQLFNQISDISYEVCMDYFIHNRITLKITWNSDKSKILKIQRVNPSSIRILELDDEMEPSEFVYNWDWSNPSSFKTKKFQAYNTNKSSDVVQILQWQDNTPNKKLYVEPSYISAISWMYMDSELSAYHKSNIKNSLNPSMLIQYYEKPEKEEKASILNNIINSFAGATKTGRAMVTFSDGPELAPKITQMEPNKLDKTFLQLTDTIQRQICYASNIDPQLLGLKTPGSLGNSGEMEYSYDIFNKSIIKPTQRKIELIFNKLLAQNILNIEVIYKDVDILPSDVKLNKIK